MSEARVLITGVSSGLGQHLAQAFKDHSYWVAGTERKATSTSYRLLDHIVLCDLRRPSDLENLCKLEIDILINNAGVLVDDSRVDPRYSTIAGTSIDILRETYEVNYFAPFVLATRHAQRMLGRGVGRIVNVTSGMGRMSELADGSYAYRSSKMSANGLTIALAALRSGCADFSAFSFCPGWIRTRMGGALARGDPAQAAEDLVGLCELPATETNGTFRRGSQQLSWFSKEMEKGA